MVLYVDGSYSRKGGSYLITDAGGEIVGYKFFKRPQDLEAIHFEVSAIIAGMEILKLRNIRGGVVLTDNESAADFFRARSSKTKGSALQNLLMAGLRIMNEVKCTVAWVPRKSNLAGILLDEFNLSRKKSKLLEYLLEKITA